MGRVSLGHIRSGQISDEDWPRITGAAGQLSEARIFIDETPALNPTELRARARRVKREHGLNDHEALILCSVAMDLKISETVDVPNWIVSACMPLGIFS
mgnify:CR=1 FL=1